MHSLLHRKKKSVQNQDPSVYISRSQVFLMKDPNHLQLYYRPYHHQHRRLRYSDPGQRRAKVGVGEGVLVVSRSTPLRKTMRILRRFQACRRGSDYLSKSPPRTSNQVIVTIVTIRLTYALNLTMVDWPSRSPATTCLSRHARPVLHPWTNHTTALAP